MKLLKECIIYAMGPHKIFKGGLLGDIDLHEIHLLLDSSSQIIRESGSVSVVIARVKKMLEAQDLPVLSVQTKEHVLWIQVDVSKNPVHEQMNFRDSGIDKNALVWRTIYFPTHSGTINDCLGFTAPALKDSLGFGHNVFSVVNVLLQTLKI